MNNMKNTCDLMASVPEEMCPLVIDNECYKFLRDLEFGYDNHTINAVCDYMMDNIYEYFLTLNEMWLMFYTSPHYVYYCDTAIIMLLQLLIFSIMCLLKTYLWKEQSDVMNKQEEEEEKINDELINDFDFISPTVVEKLLEIEENQRRRHFTRKRKCMSAAAILQRSLSVDKFDMPMKTRNRPLLIAKNADEITLNYDTLSIKCVIIFMNNFLFLM